MGEEPWSDSVAARKPGWNARFNTWYRQNIVLYFVCLMVFVTALPIFISIPYGYDQALRAALIPALLFSAGTALVIGAAAAMIWAILAGRNRLAILAALVVAASTSILFLAFGTTSADVSDSAKTLIVMRLIIAAPALCASIALVIQALTKQRWWLVVMAAAIALLASATLYIAFVQYQNSVNLDSAIVYGDKATKYVRAKEYDAAIVTYSDAIRLQPYDTNYYDYQARAYEAKGDYDSAIADYNAIIGFAPSRDYDFIRGSAYASVGSAYSTTLRYNQAITAYSQAISYASGEVDNYVSRGDLYLKLGQKDKAIADYQAALAHDGVPTSDGSGGKYWSYLTPTDRNRIEQALKGLGVTPPEATPSPTPHH